MHMLTHEVRRMLGFSREQLFDLVADVERYPEFLPWWIEAGILKRDGNVYHTNQIIGIGPVRERFSSKTVLKSPDRIDVTSSEHPFRHFHLAWQFDSLSTRRCRIVLKADLEFRSRIRQDLFRWTLPWETDRIIDAFQSRAEQFYG